MYTTVEVQDAIYVQFGSHIFSGIYASNVEHMYTIAPGYIVYCREFI